MKEESDILSPLQSNNGGKQQQMVVNGVWDGGSSTPMLAFAAVIAVLGSFSVGFAGGFTSPVQSEIMQELGLSTAEYSLFGSMVEIGGAMAAIVCGKLTDYVGRRRALGLADIFCIVGWFVIAVGQNAWLLDVGRWMLGFAMAITGYAVPIYVAEFTPKNLRGGFVILSLFALAAGTSLVFLLGLVVSWRTLALIGMVPSLVQMLGLLFIPESPRWLLMIGQVKEFEAALQQFRGARTNISQEAADIKECAEALEQLSKISMLEVLQKKYAYVLTVGLGLSALSCLSGMKGIISYAYSIFESAGFSATIGTVALALFQFPSLILGIMFLDKFGRRPLLMISTVGACLGCMVAGFSFFFKDHHLMKGFSPYLSIIGLLIILSAYPIGLGGVTVVLTSEIYPLNIKGVAGSITCLVNSIAGGTVTYTFNFFMAWSSSGTFFLLAGVCVCTFVFVVKFVPETKGKSLEEVHISMCR